MKSHFKKVFLRQLITKPHSSKARHGESWKKWLESLYSDSAKCYHAPPVDYPACPSAVQLLNWQTTWPLEYSTTWLLEYLTAGKCTGAPQSANYLTTWIPDYLNTQLLECTWILDCREIYCNSSCFLSSVLQIPTMKPCKLQNLWSIHMQTLGALVVITV